MSKPTNNRKKTKATLIMMTASCVWCGKQINVEDLEHPRNCIYFQEYLKQIV